MESVIDTLLNVQVYLGKIERYTFPEKPDNKSIARLNEKYNEFFSDQIAILDGLKKDEKTFLVQLREELKTLTKQFCLWLSDKNYYLALVVIVLLVALFYTFGYYCAKAKFT